MKFARAALCPWNKRLPLSPESTLLTVAEGEGFGLTNPLSINSLGPVLNRPNR
jgi:hypothetical protein